MKNFKEIILENTIQIPIIQRDYAQGRKDRKVDQIREGFLNSIKDVLSENKTLHLDFIYGSIKNKKFIPLDGQQRLTTLFLLYLYFGKKENIDVNYLTKFTYETRSSSREFCSKLVVSVIDFSKPTISKQIKNSNWFLAYWDNDPSIKAMLVMLDSIHLKFKEDSFYHNLDNINFNFFKLEKFGLDDDLYIKMNARGKSLTDFENFKAKFEKLLSEIDTELQEEFSFKIDNNWTDFFWKFGVADESFLIDDFFMNYFWYITEMLHFKLNSGKINDERTFKQVAKIYNSKDNIIFLFKSLDNLKTVFQSFTSIFAQKEFEINKVSLFESDINLLDKIIHRQYINIQQKILLFVTINHMINFEINENLIETLRVIRNLTNRIRHRKNGYFYYTGDLSNDHIHPIFNIFLNRLNTDIYKSILVDDLKRSNSGISDASLKQEIKKAELINENTELKPHIFELEDHPYLKGDISNFLCSDIEKLIFTNKAIREIYSSDDSLIIRSMLTIDDYSQKIGWTILGDKYFFGKKNNWEIILTASDKSDFYLKYLESYKLEGTLEGTIKSYLTNKKEWNWRYYFIKYPQMTENISSISSDNNLYAWSSDFGLEKMGGSNLNAYHKNPYINTVANLISKDASIVQYDNFSYLQVGKLKIYSVQKGWRIQSIDRQKYEDIMIKYPIKIEGETTYLIESPEKDRIEILIAFLDDLKNRN
jgi:hypothetical protein